MCGIAGSINFTPDIPLLTRDLFHRGPDEQATVHEDTVLLHHHRLAIVDIAAGKQPMHYEHLTIIFNGEIYNHLDVRKELGLQCLTGSDTETILHAFFKKGIDCLNYFDGMFAMAIHNRRDHTLFLARDRAGKKPLYYFGDGAKLLFASELNALRNQLDVSINTSAIGQFVRMGYFYKSATPYTNVFELPAGSYALVSTRQPVVEVKRWWNIHDYYSRPLPDDFATALQKTETFLHTAVKNRVESSDLEVGSFLSGGIDSGIVTAIASKYNNSLRTFTVSFEGEYDEAPLAKLVADRYQTNHHEIKISFNTLEKDIERILFNYGEPFFDSSAIPSYYVSEAARKHLTVILNGDGGDEVFAGYRRYVPFSKYDFFNNNPIVKMLAAGLYHILPVPHNKKSKYNFLYRLTDLARKDRLGVYLSSTIDSFEGFERFLLTSGESLQQVNADFNEMNRTCLSGLQKIMNLDFDNILPGDLLVKMDIATMAHSLEGRSPLLCRDLLEYIPRVSDSYKIKGTQTKFLLRSLAEKYLPAELIHQPKRGFEIPLKKWIDHELKDVIASYILSPSSFSRNFVKKEFVSDLWSRRIKAGDEKRAKMIWTLFALDVWYARCYKQHSGAGR